ncbi:MAG: hypothetical protein L7S63_03980 [Flavobacteriales bacterium]|nr:hypothetical protein [Flavobacteriales bacterium]
MPEHKTTKRNGWRAASWLAFALTMGSWTAHAQAPKALSGAEGRMLAALLERFEPMPSVGQIWTGAFVSAASKSEAVKAEVDSLERSALGEAEVLVRVGALRQELKVIRRDRNAFIAGFLTPLQQLALDSIVNPPAPSIQHFGFHDRLKCLVCKQPGEGAVFPSGVKRPDQLLTPKE